MTKNKAPRTDIGAISEVVAKAANMLAKTPAQSKNGLAAVAESAEKAIANTDALSRTLALGIGASTKARARKLLAELKASIKKEEEAVAGLRKAIDDEAKAFAEGLAEGRKVVAAAGAVADWLASRRLLDDGEVTERRDYETRVEVEAFQADAKGEKAAGVNARPVDGAEYVYKEILVVKANNRTFKFLHDRNSVPQKVVSRLIEKWVEIEDCEERINDLSARRAKVGEMLSDEYLGDLKERVEVETKLRAFDEATSAGILEGIAAAGDAMFADLEKDL